MDTLPIELFMRIVQLSGAASQVVCQSTCSFWRNALRNAGLQHPDYGVACADATARDVLNILIWLVEHGCHYDESIIEIIVQYDRQKILAWLLARDTSWYWELVWSAVKYDNVAILKMVIGPDQIIARLENMLKAACTYGSRSILEWLFNLKEPEVYLWNISDAEEALLNGRIELYYWMKEWADLGSYHHPIATITRNSTLASAKIYFSIRDHRFDDLKNAAKYGHVDILAYLIEERGLVVKSHVWNSGAKGGHVNILKWAVSKNYKFNDGIARKAIKSGSVEMMGYLAELGYINIGLFRWRRVLLAGIPMLEYLLIHHNLLLTAEMFVTALEHNKVAELEWLIDHNCPTYPSYEKSPSINIFRLLKSRELLHLAKSNSATTPQIVMWCHLHDIRYIYMKKIPNLTTFKFLWEHNHLNNCKVSELWDQIKDRADRTMVDYYLEISQKIIQREITGHFRYSRNTLALPSFIAE